MFFKYFIKNYLKLSLWLLMETLVSGQSLSLILKKDYISKQRFNDQMRMERLHFSWRRRKAINRKQLAKVDFLWCCIKVVKMRFQKCILCSHTKLSELFDKPQIKANDRIAFRDFHQKVKDLVKIYEIFKTLFTCESCKTSSCLKDLFYQNH